MIGENLNTVKLRIVASGIRQSELAEACRLSPSGVSNHVAGRRRNRTAQEHIWRAFRGLTGQNIAIAQFWGELLAPAEKGMQWERPQERRRRRRS